MSFFFLLKEGVVGLKRARLAAVITIVSICLSLSLFGSFTLVGYNLQDVFNRFYKKIRLEVFLDPSLNLNQLEKLKAKIHRNPEVEAVEYISSQAALEEFQKTFGQDLSGVLKTNPLPASFRVVLHPRYTAPERIEQLANRIRQLPGVQEVLYQREVVRFLHKYLGLGIIVLLVFALLILVVITILIFNTIRLTIHSRMNIIEIMQLVGATNLFIKSPYIIEGMLQGLLGSLLAVGILALFVNFIRDVFYHGIQVPPHLYPFLLILGTVLGLLGSYISVNKYLKY